VKGRRKRISAPVAVEASMMVDEVGPLLLKGLTQWVVAFNVPAPVGAAGAPRNAISIFASGANQTEGTLC
jgi:hypothetical protein